MNTQLKLTACIVGAGFIGSKYNEENKEFIFTHAAGYYFDQDITLAAICDTNHHRAIEASQVWKCEPYTDFEKMLVETNPQIISISSDTNTHAEYIKKSLDYPTVRAIFCEKPLAEDSKGSKEILDLIKSSQKLVLVNYFRRFEPNHIRIREQIRSGILGSPIIINCQYSKGIKHNGTHMIDLLRYFFGEPIKIQTDNIISGVRKNQDPALSANITFQDGLLCRMQTLNAAKYNIFEMDIFFEDGRIILANNGDMISLFRTTQSTKYPGYTLLGDPVVISDNMQDPIKYALENLKNGLIMGEKLLSDADNAHQNLTIAQQIIDQACNNI